MKTLIKLAAIVLVCLMPACPGCTSAEECARMCGDRGVLRLSESNSMCECNPCRVER